MTSPQVCPYTVIRMKSYYDVSIPRFLCGSIGSLHILTPKFWHWFWFYQWFFILFTNHKPCPNYIITTYSESSINTVTHVNLGPLICSAYSGRNWYTVHSSKDNDIGLNLAPKQWVLSWFSISVVNDLQINLSWFLYTLLITQRSPVLMLNTALFKYFSGKRSDSQYFVTRFPRR